MNSITVGAGLTQMAATNLSWVRRNAVLWSSIEATEGSYNWSGMTSLENELKDASSKGIQVVLIVRSTPQWARKIAGTGSSCGPIADAKMAAFGNFMNALVARYSVAPYNVKYWEMWNEEDAPYTTGDPIWGCWADPNDTYYGAGYYANMLKAAYPRMKAADSQAQVLVGGLVMDCDPRPGAGCAIAGHDPRQSLFLEGILINGGGPYFDGISFHSYDYYKGIDFGYYDNANWQSAWNTTGPVVGVKTQYITELLGKYGVTGKILIDSESAVLDYCPNDICTGGQTYENTKARYVPQLFAVAVAKGVRANIWYNVTGWNGSGLLNLDLTTLPAYTAFKFTQGELRNRAYAGEVYPVDIGGTSGVKGYKFLGNGRRVWLVWSLDGSTHTISLSSAPLAAWDYMGNAVTPASSMNITYNPIWLEWNP